MGSLQQFVFSVQEMERNLSQPHKQPQTVSLKHYKAIESHWNAGNVAHISQVAADKQLSHDTKQKSHIIFNSH